MARFFKPLLGAVALAAATLTSTGALAAYNYNAQITITAPKGTTAETAAKDKSKPSGVKFSACTPKITAVTPNINNLDAFNFAIKYDAGKLAEELADVYVIVENLNGVAVAEADGSTATPRYFVISRATGMFNTTSYEVTPYETAVAMNAAATGAIKPFASAADNLGTGAQTEVLFGGNLGLTGLDKGLWAVHTIIAKPGTSHKVNSALDSTAFSTGHPETWAAFDTAVFALGTTLPLDLVGEPLDQAGLVNYAANSVQTAALVTSASLNTNGTLSCE